MDQATQNTLQRVWTLVASVLGGLAALPGFVRGWLPGPVLARAFRELRQGESAARRAIAVLAQEVPEARHKTPTHLPEPRPLGATAQTPADPHKPHAAPLAFVLSDPMPDPLVLAGLKGGEGPQSPIVSTGAERPATGLKARMAALQAVLDDPTAAVARYIRLRDRRLPHILARSSAPRLRAGYPPGFDPRRWQEWAMDILIEIHELVRARQGAPPDLQPA